MVALSVYQELYGQPRDRYVGEFRPAVVEVREPVRLLSYERIGDAIRLDVLDAETYRRIHVAHADDHELMRLGDYDRATLQAALIQMAQEVGDANP